MCDLLCLPSRLTRQCARFAWRVWPRSLVGPDIDALSVVAAGVKGRCERSSLETAWLEVGWEFNRLLLVAVHDSCTAKKYIKSMTYESLTKYP